MGCDIEGRTRAEHKGNLEGYAVIAPEMEAVARYQRRSGWSDLRRKPSPAVGTGFKIMRRIRSALGQRYIPNPAP